VRWISIAMPAEPLAQVMDGFVRHTTGRVGDKAESPRSEVVRMPGDTTRQCQPLDRSTFGRMNITMAKVWNDQCTADPRK
jgi:hypothetical protein